MGEDNPGCPSLAASAVSLCLPAPTPFVSGSAQSGVPRSLLIDENEAVMITCESIHLEDAGRVRFKTSQREAANSAGR